MKGKIQHIKDKEVKTLPGTGYRALCPDKYILKNNINYFLEYENSSRGMVSHIAKYLTYAHHNPDTEIRLLMVESGKHLKQHRADSLHAKVIYKLAKDRAPNLTVTFAECPGDLDDLRDLWIQFYD